MPAATPTLRLHDYGPSANCLKVRMLLGLLGRPYERVPTDIFGGATLTDAFARLNPLRETPVLELGDGRVLTQSNAICAFLAEGTAWMPDDAYGRGLVAQWSAFEQERVLPGVGGARFRALTGRAATDPAAQAARLALGQEALEVLEGVLRRQAWLVGEGPTVADLLLFAYVHVADQAGLPLADRPAVAAWVERVRGLDGLVVDLEPYPANARPGASAGSIYD